MSFDKTAYQREYMRRRRAAAQSSEPIVEQANAHLKTWFATLDLEQRLDFKAFVRRSLLGRGHLYRPLGRA